MALVNQCDTLTVFVPLIYMYIILSTLLYLYNYLPHIYKYYYEVPTSWT